MAHIEKRGTIYRARYRDPSGAERSKSFARKLDAQRFLAGIEHSKLSGSYVDPVAGRVTFKTYAESWRAAQVHSVGTQRMIASLLRCHVYPVLGDRSIATIRRTEIQALVTRMAQHLAPRSVSAVMKNVVSIFMAAVEDGLIAKTPCTRISKPAITSQSVDQVLTTAQVKAMCDAVLPVYGAFVYVGAGTGMRPGELRGLTVDRVDFLRRMIKVDQQLVRRAAGDRGTDGRGVWLGPLKTAASYRTIPVSVSVIEAISAHLARYGASELGTVFSNSKGDVISEVAQRGFWAAGMKKLGAGAGVTGKGASGVTGGTGMEFPSWATPHDLRHYYASVLIGAGLSVKVVQARLGHAKATTTLDTYAHLFPDDEDRTREAVERELAMVATAGSLEAEA